ncbi:hypothetical protein HFD88_005724 [Aspergillus terreus]|nr:hypothetical protein HFD88_005724 [Aspergillus terreus]
MADHRSTLLTPLWDAAIPLNVNDVDLRLGMRVLPPTHDSSTEMLFLVARSEVADFIRHSSFHLDLTNPALKPLAKDASREEGYDLALLERTIEEKYLRFCNEDNPLHVFTKWMTRDYLAKCYLAEHYSKFHTVHLTDDQRDTAICFAMRRLECDTRVMSSHLTQGYLWLLQFHMPFVAYIHILQDLKRRPLCKHAEHAWEILSDNFEVRSTTIQMAPVAIFKNFTELVLQSWMARDAVSDANIRNPVTPQIVSTVRFWLMQNSADAVADLTCGTTSVGANSPERGGSFDLDHQGDPHSMEDIPETLPSPLSWRHRAEFVQELESETTRLDWLATDWVSRYYWS